MTKTKTKTGPSHRTSRPTDVLPLSKSQARMIFQSEYLRLQADLDQLHDEILKLGNVGKYATGISDSVAGSPTDIAASAATVLHGTSSLLKELRRYVDPRHGIDLKNDPSPDQCSEYEDGLHRFEPDEEYAQKKRLSRAPLVCECGEEAPPTPKKRKKS